MMADSKAMLCIKTDGPFHCFSFKSSIMPMDMSFKVGEEFEYKNPMDPTDVQKVCFKQIFDLIHYFYFWCIPNILFIFTIFYFYVIDYGSSQWQRNDWIIQRKT